MNYKFREIRDDKELKQHEVADAINKSRGAYANIEAETANIKLNELLTYCNHFGLSMDYVCRLTNKINYDFINIKKIDKKVMASRLDEIEQEQYEFLIPKGYTWDGATIPRMFWRLIGSKSDNRFLVPSLVHDVLCENHDYIDNQRYLSTIIFERLLYVSKVNAFNRWMIKHSVDNFQKFCGWEN